MWQLPDHQNHLSVHHHSTHTHAHAHARLNESWIWVPCLGEQQWQRLFSDARRRWRAVSRRVREAVGSPLHPPSLTTPPPPPPLSLAIADRAVRWEIKRACCCCRHAWEMDASVFLRLPLSPDAHRQRKKGTTEIGEERKGRNAWCSGGCCSYSPPWIEEREKRRPGPCDRGSMRAQLGPQAERTRPAASLLHD